MPAKNIKVVILVTAVVAILIIAGICGVVLSQNDNKTPGELFTAGMAEYNKANYKTASSLFWNAHEGYKSVGDEENANTSLHWKFTSDRVLAEYNLTRAQAEASVRALFPSLSATEIRTLLANESIEHIVSDGETWFFSDVAKNIAFRNMTLMHLMMESRSSVIYRSLKDLVRDNKWACETYFNMTNFTTVCNLTIPRGELPEGGSLKIWIPVPIASSSQIDITVEISPDEYVVSTTSPDGDLGLIYLQISLDNIHEDIIVDVTCSFSEYQVHWDVDPSNIGEYDKSSELYIKYTASSDNIQINQEIASLAESVVDEEENPYLQAKLIYEYVVGNISYSYVPHASLCALGIAESEYVRTNGHGDCGAQSMYYCALVRSLGIPARTHGGYQSFGNGTGCHFWAEFYIPNCGWVPVDVTVAESVDWEVNVTAEERSEFKAFFFGNLDPYRLVIQNDVDLPLVPGSGDSVQFTTAYQYPAYVCIGSVTDLSMTLMNVWSMKIMRTG